MKKVFVVLAAVAMCIAVASCCGKKGEAEVAAEEVVAVDSANVCCGDSTKCCGDSTKCCGACADSTKCCECQK